MAIKNMIEAGMKAFKEKVLLFCRQEAEGGFSPESAAVVTQGIE